MDAPALGLCADDDGYAEPLPFRGVGWVLRSAATLATLSATAVILTVFAYQLAAEQALARAAAAGLREATQPRATSQSVDAAIRRELGSRSVLSRAVAVFLERNGASVRGVVYPQRGDRFSIVLRAPSSAALPRVVNALVPWLADAAIGTRVEGQPGS